MSVLTALFASKLSTGLVAAGVVVAGGVGIAVTTSQADANVLSADATVSASPTAAADPAADSAAHDLQLPGDTNDSAAVSLTTNASTAELCNDFANGNLSASATALAALAIEANGAANISALCVAPTVSVEVAAQVEAKSENGAEVEINANVNVESNDNNTSADVQSGAAVVTAPSESAETADDAEVGTTSNSDLPKLNENGSSLDVTLGAGR